jgi:hypothetical protein
MGFLSVYHLRFFRENFDFIAYFVYYYYAYQSILKPSPKNQVMQERNRSGGKREKIKKEKEKGSKKESKKQKGQSSFFRGRSVKPQSL